MLDTISDLKFVISRLHSEQYKRHENIEEVVGEDQLFKMLNEAVNTSNKGTVEKVVAKVLSKVKETKSIGVMTEFTSEVDKLKTQLKEKLNDYSLLEYRFNQLQIEDKKTKAKLNKQLKFFDELKNTSEKNLKQMEIELFN